MSCSQDTLAAISSSSSQILVFQKPIVVYFEAQLYQGLLLLELDCLVLLALLLMRRAAFLCIIMDFFEHLSHQSIMVVQSYNDSTVILYKAGHLNPCNFGKKGNSF